MGTDASLLTASGHHLPPHPLAVATDATRRDRIIYQKGAAMPHVRMKRHITGFRDGKPWPARGELLECSSDREADHLVQAGYATHVLATDVDDSTAGDDEGSGVSPLVPPDGKVDDVVAWVDGDPARAAVALEAERAGKARKSLIDALEQLTTPADPPASDPAGGEKTEGDGEGKEGDTADDEGKEGGSRW